jgi:restriction alleviation protein Lar
MKTMEKGIQLENAIPDLLACPFCGSLGVAIVGFAARCGTCGAVGPFGPTEAEAAKRWNERAKYPGASRWDQPQERTADDKDE